MALSDDEMIGVNVTTKTGDTSQPRSSQKSCARVPHFVYHFDIVHFAVEDRLYRLPKRNLQHSTFFGDMFGPPNGEFSFTVPKEGWSLVEESVDSSGLKGQIGFCGEGESDKNPIVLEGIKKDAFDAFLKVLYPNHLHEKVLLSTPQWTSVLDLAHMWGFEHIRKIAIDNLINDPMDPLPKVLLAHKYEISDWYEDAYVRLAMRAKPLSVDEARALGLEFSIKMAQVREEGYASGASRCTREVYRSEFTYKSTKYTTCGGSVKNGAPNEAQLRAIVRNVFALNGPAGVATGWGSTTSSWGSSASPISTSWDSWH